MPSSLLPFVSLALLTSAASAQLPASPFLNLDPADAPALTRALSANSVSPTGAGPVIVLEAKGPLTPATVGALKTYVQQGGALLLGLDRHPGSAATQLHDILPTIAWTTQGDAVSRPINLVPITTGAADPELFATPLPVFELPYAFPMRPVSAVERGNARYDRYLDDSPASFYEHPAGEFWWTRPLLNRDWRVRLSAGDRAASPLLITGRYGAGKVAVFAGPLTGDSPQLEALWKPAIAWLIHPEAKASEPATGAIAMATTQTPDGLRLNITNKTAQPVKVQSIARILSWEQAYISDFLKPVTIPANASTTVDIPLPKPTSTGYQALDFRRAFDVRLGVLSESGATLLAGAVVPVDLTPSTAISLSTDNLYNVPYPYAREHAPDYGSLQAWANRMGTPVEQYAYPPSSTVRAKAVFTNGVRNVAPLATVTDETNPANLSVMALNDGGARFNKGPRGGMEAWSVWNGKAHTENVLHFHFAAPTTLTAITLNGNPPGQNNAQKFGLGRNPGAITVESDKKTILRNATLDQLFASENGLVRLAFPAPVQGTDIVVRFPWVDSSTIKREAPMLGEIELEGTQTALPAEVHGEASLVLHDGLTGAETTVATKPITIPPGGRVEWAQGFQLPAANSAFYQLQLRFNGQSQNVPILAIQPVKTLTSVLLAHPAHAPQENFVTTHGFRNLFPLGAGTREDFGAWESPDDLIYAYEHKLKQTGDGGRSWAGSLYVTESDMRHYSTPWTIFPNGDSVLADGTPAMVDGMKRQANFAAASDVTLGFGDRWDSGPSLPSLYDWPELIAFDQYLRDQHKPGLAGRTHAELSKDVNQNHAADWSLWHEHRYVATVEDLSNTFAALGKKMSITGQGVPMTSNADALILSKTISGMNSDSTWGMDSESIPMTTGRQLAAEALNPEWNFGFNFVWGWDSAIINNVFWYGPVGTTEPGRRHYYDTAWRGVVAADGSYKSSFTYGYGNNGGEAWTFNRNDYQQNWYAQERFSLLYPDRPLGAGLLVSSAPVDSPTSTLFSGGGMGPDGKSEALIHRIEVAFATLHNSGLDIPYTGNINAVQSWKAPASFIVYDLAACSPQELATLHKLAESGIRIAAFNSPPNLEAKFYNTLHGTTLMAEGNVLHIPINADDLTPALALELAPALSKWLNQPIIFPAGTMGYSFVSGPRTMIVLEDWLEQPRDLTLRVHAFSPTAPHAAGLNDHTTLSVTREGSDWIVHVPIRPGDGEVVVLDQTP